MYSKEPDPDDCLDAKNMFEPDPDDSQVGESSNSNLYLGTHGVCRGPYTYWKPELMECRLNGVVPKHETEPDSDDMLASEAVKDETNDEPDPDDCYAQAKHLEYGKTIKPDPDDSQEKSTIYAEPDPDDSQENSAIHANPDPYNKLGASRFDSFETLPALGVLSSWMVCMSKTDIVSSDVDSSGHDAVAIDASQENSTIHAEPDPDDSQENSAINAEPDPDDSQENSAIHAEPDPDDSPENSAIHAEPDPDDSQENDFTHSEPDPDDSLENDFMHAEPDPDDSQQNSAIHPEPDPDDSQQNSAIHPEPDPDDSQQNSAIHPEPDPDDKWGVSRFTDSFETLPALEVLSSLMVYVSKPDIVSSNVDASGNDAVAIDASRVMPMEAAKLLGTLVKIIEEMINYHGQTFFRSPHEVKPLNVAKCGGISAAGLGQDSRIE